MSKKLPGDVEPADVIAANIFAGNWDDPLRYPIDGDEAEEDEG
jgi:hypothetical protein